MPASASTTSAGRHLGTNLTTLARRLEPVVQTMGQDVDEALQQRGVQRGVHGHLPDQARQRRQRGRGGQHGDGPAHHLAHVAEQCFRSKEARCSRVIGKTASCTRCALLGQRR